MEQGLVRAPQARQNDSEIFPGNFRTFPSENILVLGVETQNLEISFFLQFRSSEFLANLVYFDHLLLNFPL